MSCAAFVKRLIAACPDESENSIGPIKSQCGAAYMSEPAEP